MLLCWFITIWFLILNLWPQNEWQVTTQHRKKNGWWLNFKLPYLNYKNISFKNWKLFLKLRLFRVHYRYRKYSKDLKAFIFFFIIIFFLHWSCWSMKINYSWPQCLDEETIYCFVGGCYAAIFRRKNREETPTYFPRATELFQARLDLPPVAQISE